MGAALAAALSGGKPATELDPCKTKRDLWLCIRSPSHPQRTCVSQAEACQHGETGAARGEEAIPITSDDLVTAGFDIEVLEGGANGRVLTAKVGAKYPGGIHRRVVCSGLQMNFAGTEPITYVSFFLDVPERALVSDEMARLEASVKASQEKEADLMAALNNARDAADRARIQAELQKAQEQTAAARRGLSGGGLSSSGSAGAKPSKPACNCTPGDPLCSCL